MALAILVAAGPALAGSIDDFLPFRPRLDVDWNLFRLYVPQNYDPGHSYPLILSLHGLGGGGTDNVGQLKSGQLNIEDMVAGTQYDCFILRRSWAMIRTGHAATFERVLMSLTLVRGLYNVDGQRIYLTGVSMGGNGAWWAGDHYGQYFACVVPLAGWYDTGRASHYLNMPLWVFHGEADGTVNVGSDRAMIAAIRALGGNPLYTEYPGGGHAIWPQVYTEAALYPWMFAQSRTVAAPLLAMPGVSYSRVDLGDGRYRYSFWLDSNDGTVSGYKVILSFYGIDGSVIQDTRYYGVVDVNTDTLAAAWDGQGDPPYHMGDDTWFCEPFVSNPINYQISPLDGSLLSGLAHARNSYSIAATSGTQTNLNMGVPLAQIVATGAVAWKGTIDHGRHVDLPIAGHTEPVAVRTILGDFNSDGVVDIGDYTTWADHFGMDRATSFAAGSFMADGVVDIGDYTTWADHFGNVKPMTVAQPVAPAVTAEPAAATDAAPAAAAVPAAPQTKAEAAAARRAARIQARQDRLAQRAAARAAKLAK